MNNKGQINSREIKIQGMLDSYLKINSSKQPEEGIRHLDEDSLSAFVDGNLNESEATPIVNHLTSCSYCRHISAELIKLDLTFTEGTQPITIPKSEPTRVADVLNGVLSKIFGTNDSAVFAHNENEEDSEKDDTDKVD